MQTKIKHKKAKFELEPDGFSIHTFELYQRLSHSEYQDIRDYLYKLNKSEEKPCTYPNEYGNLACNAFSKYGVGITLESGNGSDGKQTMFGIRIFVSPRRLLDPDTSYLGILPPESKAVDKVAKKFHKLFKGSPIPDDMDGYTVWRIAV